MSEEREEKSGLKVNDRRRFDSAGNERGDDLPPAQPTPSPQASAPRAQSAESGPSGKPLAKPELQGGGGDINFSSFVLSLATQALMQLGEMPPPDGMAIEPDMDAARQTIAILGLIEEKTKGNLVPEEAELLKEVLHSIRICYVRRSKGEG
ncbi:MAG: hypothetical protein RL417_500 [Pseudomonadota bacterium]